MVTIKQKTLIVPSDSAGSRLDKYLSDSFKDLSRTIVQNLITEAQITVNEKHTKSGYRLKLYDKISINIPDLKKTNIEEEKIDLNIVFEDKDLIVINKPQGMITHPASGVYKGTLVNALLSHCKDSLSGINGVLRPGIVHRLDKDTSGLIIACKNDNAHNEIAKQIQERSLKRYYLAIVHGKVPYDQGIINKPIGRDKIHRHKMAVTKDGRVAITHWKILKKLEKATFIECSLETGRTHQIRVHMKSLGYPILGDKTYGKRNDLIESMMLHAYKLIFIHPRTRKKICLETKIPERFLETQLSFLQIH